MKVLIIAPHHKSRVALKLFDILEESGYEVGGIVVRKITLKRLKQEIRRDGFRNIFQKFILKSLRLQEKSKVSPSLLDTRFSSIRHITSLTPVFVTDFLNLDTQSCDVALFAGGGYVGKRTLSKIKVVNCHMGILPWYRGMDVVEWPILNGEYHRIGLTCHLMEPKIDMGSIISRHHLSYTDFDSIEDLRCYMLGLMPSLLLDSLSHLSDGRLEKQSEQVGRLYFKMASNMKKYLS